MSELKCPVCGEMLQKYGEVDPDTGTSIVLGANCPKCGIGDSDIKLWQELIRTRKALEIAVDALKRLEKELYFNNAKQTGHIADSVMSIPSIALEQITAILENKNGNC